MVHYNKQIHVELRLEDSTSNAAVRSKIDAVTYVKGAKTYTGEALGMASTLFDGSDKRKILILLTGKFIN